MNAGNAYWPGWALLLIACMMQPVKAQYSDGFEDSDLPIIPIVSDPASTRQTARPIGSTMADQGYHEYLPPGYGTGDAYPLLLFIHGLGENGDGDSQLSRVLANGPPRLIDRDEWPNERPFVVLSPQHSGGGCTTSSEIRNFIEFAVSAYDIDPTRVYLTGLSCGAIGSWNYLRDHVDTQIAAMLPIAGDGRNAFNTTGCSMGLTPIWAFHGDADGVVTPQGSIQPIEGLLGCSPPALDVSLVLYPGLGHDSWSRTYNLNAGYSVYQWLLQYRNTDSIHLSE